MQGPPVYKDHLYTRITCIQGSPVYKDHPCIETTKVWFGTHQSNTIVSRHKDHLSIEIMNTWPLGWVLIYRLHFIQRNLYIKTTPKNPSDFSLCRQVARIHRCEMTLRSAYSRLYRRMDLKTVSTTYHTYACTYYHSPNRD